MYALCFVCCTAHNFKIHTMLVLVYVLLGFSVNSIFICVYMLVCVYINLSGILLHVMFIC